MGGAGPTEGRLSHIWGGCRREATGLMDDCVVDLLSFDFRQLIRGAVPAARLSAGWTREFLLLPPSI